MSDRPVLQPRSTLLRPERRLDKRSAMERLQRYLSGWASRPLRQRLGRYRGFLPLIHSFSAQLEALSEAQLQVQVSLLKQRLMLEGFNDRLVCEAFAIVREVAGRTLGMRHFDSQLLGGLVMFHGNIAEMQTGEGKTLTATLPAAVAALGGVSTHVITVNDYLTERDAEEMTPVYQALGLTVGSIINSRSLPERQLIYGYDVVYCTNNELVFDYLKDSIQLGESSHPLHLYAERLQKAEAADSQLMLQGLHYAVVDEADSVLMDEARTPLIISGPEVHHPQQERLCREAIEVAASLVEEDDYKLEKGKRQLSFTLSGEERVLALTAEYGKHWVGKVRKLELVHQALTALLLFERDHHYLIQDGKVQIVDEHTGRVMADRTWERGLHQMIELKEGVEMTSPRETLAKISYQRFFRMYRLLSGMTGTGSEVADELWTVYHLPLVKIPTHRKSLRLRVGSKVCRDAHEKWRTVADRVQNLQQQGCSVLVGTHSVARSEELAELLEERGLSAQILNARQDSEEADIVARAGQTGQITVATNMAGRGTDIKLSDEVKAHGGLYVILTEFHEASRIDRQLEGRCARQGDPGSFEVIVARDDFLLAQDRPGFWDRMMNRPLQLLLGGQYDLYRMRRAQKRLEKRHEKMRYELLETDERQGELMSFVAKRV